MASPEKDTRQIAQSSESLPESPPDPENLRRELTELEREICTDKRSDALCLFLQVHGCIFDRIAASRLPHMMALNPLFARKFIWVCMEFRGGGEFEHGPRLWIHALNFYMEHPTEVVHAMVMMAEAHILEDLPDTLYDLEAKKGISIDEAQYEAALEEITTCLEKMSRGVDGGESVLDFLYFKLARHFGMIRGFQNVKIAHLRKSAWKEYQLHKHFAINQRQRKKSSEK
jgi:hypothetical protein